MTGEEAPPPRTSATDSVNEAPARSGSAPSSAPSAPAEARAPAQTEPLNAIALAKEIILDRLQGLLEWLLHRLKRYRARRGNWWER